MIKKIYHCINKNTYPYRNLAIEEYLMHMTKDGECILYLWQNEKTVVIGRNQNSRAEVNIEALEEDGGYLVRRLSGGGAVFHDLGNLNFTFLVRTKDFDKDKQSEVILRMLKNLGINGERTGRNDLTVDGKKFSGHAYFSSGGFSYHHGTLMVNVDKDKLTEYLNVPESKLAGKGVKSVRSRVINLSEVVPDLSIEKVADGLILAFKEVYGLPSEEISIDELPEDEIGKLQAKFESRDWKYGREFSMQHKVEKRFEWGNLDIGIELSANNRIAQCEIYSDAMDGEFIKRMALALLDCKFSYEDMANAVEGAGETKENIAIIPDVKECLKEFFK